MDKYQEEQAQKTNQMLRETEEIKRGMMQLEDEKEELFEQLQEVTVHNATQNILKSKSGMAHVEQEPQEITPSPAGLKEVPLMVESLQTSMVRKIKIKERKKKEISGFEYEEQGRKRRKLIKDVSKETRPANEGEEHRQIIPFVGPLKETTTVPATIMTKPKKQQKRSSKINWEQIKT